MHTLHTLFDHIRNRNASDSGDPLVTSLIIIGITAVVAIAIFVALGNVMAERADQVAGDIECSGSHIATDRSDLGC